ncbi:coiled-coil domain-containing protein 116 [Rhynchocyon petersi]
MARCRQHSGYLADDEAGHTSFMARVQPSRKPLFPEMRTTCKLGYEHHPPSKYGPAGSSMLRGNRRTTWDSQPFGSFLDFLVEGQVLDSLQTVVEEATERMAAMRTKAGEPLVEVQDPLQEPSSRRRPRARPSLSTVHRHRTQPSLCIGHLNNYPSCSSSTSDFHRSFSVGGLGLRNCECDRGYHGPGFLPPVKDKQLLERSLKHLLQLENKGVRSGAMVSEGKMEARAWSGLAGWLPVSLRILLFLQRGQNKPFSQRDSLLWGSQCSRESSQWTPEQPLSCFSDLLGSGPGTPVTSELGFAEKELSFLKQEFNKEMKSMLNQPAAFNLSNYSSVQEPYHTLDFLAKHHLFPALQHVVHQAVDKLSSARCHDGCPLFCSPPFKLSPEPEPLPHSEMSSDSVQPSPDEDPADGEEFYKQIPAMACSSKMGCRKSAKSKRWDKVKEEGCPVSGTQGTTKLKLKSPHLKHNRKKPQPSISSKTTTSHFSPWEEELIGFLVEKAISLLLYKYKFERNLSKQLGFVSFPVTEVLLDLFIGFKKVEGSRIRLSSNIDWTCLLRRLEQAQWAHQARQHTAFQHTESPSTLPRPSSITDQVKATEHDLFTNTELLEQQEPTAEEKDEDEEENPIQLDPKLSRGSSSHVDYVSRIGSCSGVYSWTRIGSGSGSAPHSRTRVDSSSGPHSRTRVDSGSGPHSRTRVDSSSGPHSRTRVDSGSGPHSRTRVDSSAGPYSSTRVDSGSGPHSRTRVDSGSGPHSRTRVDSGSGPYSRTRVGSRPSESRETLNGEVGVSDDKQQDEGVSDSKAESERLPEPDVQLTSRDP